MTGDEQQSREDRALKSLEEELRRLPKVNVPDTLEQRLLAAIPETQAATVSRSRVRWRCWAVGVGSAVAAAAVIAATVMLPLHRSTDDPDGSAGVLTDTSSLCVLGDQTNAHSQETMPCDVLPPLPDWR